MTKGSILLEFMKLLLLAAFFYFSSNAYAEATYVPFGVMADFSGSAAAFGDECRQGVEAAIAVQSKPLASANYRLKPIYADAAGQPKKAVSEFKKLIAADGIAALIAVRSNVALTLNPLADAANVSMLALAGHEDLLKNNHHTFRFWGTASEEARLLVDYLSPRSARSAAVLSIEEDFPLALREHFTRFWLEKGGRVVFDEVIAPSQADESVSALMTKARSVRPDLLFINADVAQAGVLIRKARQLGIKSQFVSNFRVRDPAMPALAGKENLEGLVFVETVFDRPGFIAALSKATSSGRPGANSYNCFAASTAIAQALLSERPTADMLRTGLFKGLGSTSQINMPDGPLPFTSREAKAPQALRIFRKGIPEALKASANGVTP